jgi:hypothetical protein
MRPGLMVRYVTSYVLLAVMFLAVPWSASPVSLHAQSPSSPEKERSSGGGDPQYRWTQLLYILLPVLST